MNRLLNAVFAVLVGSMLAMPAFAMDPACQPVADANAKMLATPTHITSTTTAAYAGGKPRNTEMIYAGNAIYVNVGGKWARTKMTPQDMLKMEQENSGNKKRDLPLCARRIGERRSDRVICGAEQHRSWNERGTNLAFQE